MAWLAMLPGSRGRLLTVSDKNTYRKISNCSCISNRSRPPNFQKITIFLQKVSYFENLQLKPHGDF